MCMDAFSAGSATRLQRPSGGQPDCVGAARADKEPGSQAACLAGLCIVLVTAEAHTPQRSPHARVERSRTWAFASEAGAELRAMAAACRGRSAKDHSRPARWRGCDATFVVILSPRLCRKMFALLAMTMLDDVNTINTWAEPHNANGVTPNTVIDSNDEPAGNNQQRMAARGY